MNWLPWCLAAIAVLSIIQLVLDYRVKYIANDGRTKQHKASRKLLLAVAFTGLAANPFVGLINNVQMARKAEKAKVSFDQQFTNLNLNFQSKMVIVDSNQVRLADEFKNLSMAIATNPSMTVALRSQLLQAGKSLEAIETNIVDVATWTSDLFRERALVRLEASRKRQTCWDEGAPVYDYAMSRLQTMLVEVGKQKGELLYSNVRPLPTMAPSLPFDFARLDLGTNSPWKFDANVNWWAEHTQLTVNAVCSNTTSTATMRIQVYSGSVVTA